MAKKGQPKFMGPFAVKKVMGPVTHMIELPPSMKKAHNVFHVSQLRKFNRREGDHKSLSIVIDAQGTVEQEVTAVLDTRKNNRRRQYLVQFEGESVEEGTWMNKNELPNCKELIKRFENLSRATSPKRG